MNTTIDLIQQKIRDLTNRLDLLSHRGITNSGENQSNTVNNLKIEINLVKEQLTSFQSSMQQLEGQYSEIITTINNCNSALENLSATTNSNTSNIESLQATVDTQSTQLTQFQTNIQTLITEFESKLTELSNSVDSLTRYVDNLVISGSTTDNELCFIVNGTYVPESDIDKIANGTYTVE